MNLSLVQDFITLFLGLIVEAFPFVVLGVLVSVAVGIFFKEEWVFKYLPKNRFISHLVLSLTGILMPVCECGNVPVVRRFLQKGFGVSHSVTFLLAAPILNPITFWSTKEAFATEPVVLIVRMLGALFIANSIGILISYKKNQETLLNTTFYHDVCEHPHHESNKLDETLEIFRTEFFEVMKMLIIGAGIAAISQTFIPRSIILAIGSNAILSIFAMMLLAFVISICANVDAFFALNYAGTFTLGSILSFLIFGPMIDIKIFTMLRTTFQIRFLSFIAAYVFLCALCIGLIVNFFI